MFWNYMLIHIYLFSISERKEKLEKENKEKVPKEDSTKAATTEEWKLLKG